MKERELPADANDREIPAVKPDFTSLVHEHWDAVFRLARTLAGNDHAAEDLTQETFLRAMSRYQAFVAGTNLRAWLLRIATNACFDELRKRKRARPQSLEQEVPGQDAPPEHRLETAEQAALAKAALEDLSELTRLVFHLRVQEELSFREIAELAETTEQSARWHMHHARTKLLARLEATPSPRDDR